MTTRIYSPAGSTGLASTLLAPVPDVLAGRRIAVLDNGKPGAELLMGVLAEQIAGRAGAQLAGVFQKGSAATACAPDHPHWSADPRHRGGARRSPDDSPC